MHYMKMKMIRFSILHDMNKCFVCKKPRQAIHEIYFGTANREQSIKYGCCVGLCHEHHNMSNAGVHYNKELDLKLKRLCQKQFTRVYPSLDFVSIFGKNYL
jgi:hypothetical protein